MAKGAKGELKVKVSAFLLEPNLLGAWPSPNKGRASFEGTRLGVALLAFSAMPTLRWSVQRCHAMEQLHNHRETFLVREQLGQNKCFQVVPLSSFRWRTNLGTAQTGHVRWRPSCRCGGCGAAVFAAVASLRCSSSRSFTRLSHVVWLSLVQGVGPLSRSLLLLSRSCPSSSCVRLYLFRFVLSAVRA